jgi:D-serine deaminase-like pyridoxal phosphate-dependent protein
MNLTSISTPAALVDTQKMQHNIDRMQARVNELGVAFRPHVKTTKCLPIVEAQRVAGARGITVSTLKEAEQFFSAGVTDILYAVGMVATKLPQALALRLRGCDLKIICDSAAAAQAISQYGQQHSHTFEVWLEIDTDGHRSGLKPESEALIEAGRALIVSANGGARLNGVMTHAGASYDLCTPQALQAIAEQERSLCVRAAERLRAAGMSCSVVSVGSTPTALSATSLAGVTEVRAGVYVFFDLVMTNIGVCDVSNIALSVLTTVIGHQPEKNWIIVDAGWMAMSRDRGTQKQACDYGYGQVCDVDGHPIQGLVMTSANQEHGIITAPSVSADDLRSRYAVGRQLRVLPNHACATAAQYPEYVAFDSAGATQTWPRFYGW